MKLFYTSLIWAFLLLGLGHMGFTFKKFDKIEPNALWFFYAAFGLIFCAFLNFINLKEQTPLIRSLTISANILQFLFSCILVSNIQKPIIFIAVTLSLLLIIGSVVYNQKTSAAV